MGWKCVPQVVGLVRGEPTTPHRANGEKIAKEMGRERYSQSKTLDRSRSSLNSYDGYDGRGADAWDAMCEDAAAYRVQVKTKNGVRERALKSDAVIGCAVVVLPPVDMMTLWSAEDCDRFFADAADALHEIEPRIFRPGNRRLTARHRDEGYVDLMGAHGEHEHSLYDCIDDAGKYCGNIVDRKLKEAINQRFPAFMRERGWEIDDCDITDRERMGYITDDEGHVLRDAKGEAMPVDPVYRRERLEKRRRQGRSVNQHDADRKAVASQEAAKLYETARQTEIYTRRERHMVRAEANEYARETREDADEYARTVRHKAGQDADKVRQDAAQDAEAVRKAAERDAARIRQEAERDAQAVRLQVAAARDERDEAKREALDYASKAQRLKKAHDGLQTALQGDLMTFQAQEAKQGAASLLDALGATVRPLIAEAANRVRVPPSVTPGPVAGAVYAEMRRRMAAMDAKSRPTAVEGPTM